MAQLNSLIVNGNSRLIGDVMAPTAAAGTNNAEIATTAFVKTAIDNAITNAKQEKTATANGTVTPDSGKILSKVTVNVPASAVTSGNRACASAVGDQTGIDVTTYKTVSISGIGSGSLSKGSGSAGVSGSSNVTLDTTNNGISVTATGSGSVYVGTAGYLAKDTSQSSNSATATKYITAITVPKDVPFSATTTADTALDDTSVLSITNNAYRKTSVSNAVNGTAVIDSIAGSTLDSTYTAAIANNAYRLSYIANAENARAVIVNSAGTTLETSPGAYVSNNLYRMATIDNIARTDSTMDSGVTAYIENRAYRAAQINNNANGYAYITNQGGCVVQSTSSSAGYVNVNAYYNGSLTGNVTVVNNGVWKQNTPTPKASAQGPYWGRTMVAAVPTETKTITSNGTYTPTSGKFFSGVTVDVSTPESTYYFRFTNSTSARMAVMYAGIYEGIVEAGGEFVSDHRYTLAQFLDEDEGSCMVNVLDDVGIATYVFISGDYFNMACGYSW